MAQHTHKLARGEGPRVEETTSAEIFTPPRTLKRKMDQINESRGKEAETWPVERVRRYENWPE